jgi:hypothetical protein
MKTRTIELTLALCFFAGAACFAADDPNMGTWKLNEAKSKLTPGTGKNTTVVYEAAGDQVKVTIDGTDRTVSRRITSGPVNLTVKIMPSQVIQSPICGPTRRLTTTSWSSP